MVKRRKKEGEGEKLSQTEERKEKKCERDNESGYKRMKIGKGWRGLEMGNGKFKYMNYATFNDTNQVVIKDMTQPTPELLQALGESHGPPGLQTNYPGGYHEVITSGGAIAPDLPANPASCFLISAFRASSDIDSLDVEKEIDLLTGLDIAKNASSSSGKFQVGPWALYKRFTPAIPFQPFDLVFRLELQGLDSDLEPAKKLVQELNKAPTVEGVERSCTELYQIQAKDVVVHE
ncbi:uncharacterized protein LOC129282815 [Lytechinus pictus]|uniref:uncharacterized protein LOC129282815 n=1 Tax=Lytechinus pictus TaxID=7653 RepID=UPI0030B9CF16